MRTPSTTSKTRVLDYVHVHVQNTSSFDMIRLLVMHSLVLKQKTTHRYCCCWHLSRPGLVPTAHLGNSYMWLIAPGQAFVIHPVCKQSLTCRKFTHIYTEHMTWHSVHPALTVNSTEPDTVHNNVLMYVPISQYTCPYTTCPMICCCLQT